MGKILISIGILAIIIDADNSPRTMTAYKVEITKKRCTSSTADIAMSKMQDFALSHTHTQYLHMGMGSLHALLS